jgi:DNA-binding XRE family transcriptional regulator
MTEKRSRSAALKHLYDRYVGGDPERIASYERAAADSHVARQVYQLRTEAGLSQREMAARVGTTASVICRLEDADYDGHSLAMLRRIAAAVGKSVEVRFVSAGDAPALPPKTPVAATRKAARRRAKPTR